MVQASYSESRFGHRFGLGALVKKHFESGLSLCLLRWAERSDEFVLFTHVVMISFVLKSKTQFVQAVLQLS